MSRYTVSRKLVRPNCKNCGTFVKFLKSIYCSLQCHREYDWRLRKRIIEDSGVFPKSENSKVAKRYLKEKHGNVCSVCNLDEWLGKEMPLVLDHIDGNFNNLIIANYRLICPNCDTFTNTYKNRNKGNGRFKRRQRYSAGLSY